ncbi:MAG: hypothetical protein JWL81_432 [Verrucomicrobiales bacterium]|nr:hypothetical protein [Verrucomicrobiales bacterium]
MKEPSVLSRLRRLLLPVLCGITLGLQSAHAAPAAAPAPGEDPVKESKSQQPDSAEKTLFSGAKDTGYTPPNPIDKFIALDDMFGGKVNWKSIMEDIGQDVETKNIRDTDFLIPLLMGIRVADGVMTVKVRSVQDLNAAADDIKDMATKLRVPERDMVWANKARAEAASGEWASVFMSLGFMQKKVLDKLAEAKADQRSLVMISGWIQGLRYSASAVLKHYDDTVGKNSVAGHPSYQLRDPKLVAWLITLVKGLSPEKQALPEVIAMRKGLEEIYDLVDIDIDPKVGKISKPDVEKLAKISGDIVTAIVKKAE